MKSAVPKPEKEPTATPFATALVIAAIVTAVVSTGSRLLLIFFSVFAVAYIALTVIASIKRRSERFKESATCPYCHSQIYVENSDDGVHVTRPHDSERRNVA
jgi:NADH:ubiquinone oxidoreductase subunit 2 (subunit N)